MSARSNSSLLPETIYGHPTTGGMDEQQAIQDRIFETAEQVALKHALNLHWSTWHSWNRCDRETINPATTTSKEFWSHCGQFASCVSQAESVIADIKAALEADPELAGYASRVLLGISDEESVTHGDDYHALCYIPFNDCCIVIDLNTNATALRVPLGGFANSEIHLSIFSPSNVNRYEYRSVKSPSGDDMRQLVWGHLKQEHEPVYEDDDCEDDFKDDYGDSDSQSADATFTPLSEKDSHALVPKSSEWAFDHLVIPGAKAAQDGIPPRKWISVRRLWDKPLMWYPSSPYGATGRYIATTCQIQVNFEGGEIVMKIPYYDFLDGVGTLPYLSELQEMDLKLDESDKVVKSTLKKFRNIHPELVGHHWGVDEDGASIILHMDLEPKKCASAEELDSTKRKILEWMRRMAGELGLPSGEFNKFVESIYRIWRRR